MSATSVKAAPRHGPASAPDAAVRPMPRRILIVEDNELARTQLQKALAVDRALRVDTVADGNKALQTLLEENFSVVLTDLRMPRLDGMQLIQEIGAFHRRIGQPTRTKYGHVVGRWPLHQRAGRDIRADHQHACGVRRARNRGGRECGHATEIGNGPARWLGRRR